MEQSTVLLCIGEDWLYPHKIDKTLHCPFKTSTKRDTPLYKVHQLSAIAWCHIVTNMCIMVSEHHVMTLHIHRHPIKFQVNQSHWYHHTVILVHDLFQWIFSSLLNLPNGTMFMIFLTNSQWSRLYTNHDNGHKSEVSSPPALMLLV